MLPVLIICIAASITMITLVLTKPKITVNKTNVSTYWIPILLAAVILVVLGFIKLDEIFDGLTADEAINPLKIIVLFISMTILSIFLDETGFFKYLANTVLKRSGTSQFKLFTALFLTVSVLTVFTSNDIIILTFTPFICYFAKNAKIDPMPYLIAEFVAANTSSMLLIIGNPTNIYLATASDIAFVDYLKVMAVPTLLASLAAYTVMLIIFNKTLKTHITGTAEDVTIQKKPQLVIGIILLSAATVLLAVSSYIKIEMWIVAAICAAGLVIAVLGYSAIKKTAPCELGAALKRSPFEIIPFLISMFVLVMALDKYQVTDKIGKLLGDNNTIINYGISSVLLANLINNIPMSVLFSSVLCTLNQAVAAQGVYAVIIGSNIGAFLTPLGALAGIMWLQILKENNIKFSFLRFVKHGTVIALPTLAAALVGLIIVL